MSKKKKNAKGIATLPDNLYEAIIEVEKSELVKKALVTYSILSLKVWVGW